MKRNVKFLREDDTWLNWILCTSSSSLFNVYFSMLARFRRFTKNFASPNLSVFGIIHLQPHLLHISVHTLPSCLPTSLPALPSTTKCWHFFTQSSSSFLSTCPNHLNLPRLITLKLTEFLLDATKSLTLFHFSTWHHTSIWPSTFLLFANAAYLQLSLTMFH